LEIGLVASVPALSMVFGSLAVSAGEPSEKVQARLQHLSAGLLIGAVITDIFPILRALLIRPTGSGGSTEVQPWNLLAATVGFSLALLLMYSVKSLGLEEAEEVGGNGNPVLEEPLLKTAAGDGPNSEEESRHLRLAVANLAARADALSQLVTVEDEEVDREAVDEEVHAIDFLVDAARRRCRGSEPMDTRSVSRLRHHAAELAEDIANVRRLSSGDIGGIDKQLATIALTLRHVHSHAERQPFRRWAPSQVDEAVIAKEGSVLSVATVPWSLVLAVVIDSVIDGMLIGLAGSVALTSAWLMAAATAIEMGFLGYSYACSVVKTTGRFASVLILGLPPCGILSAAIAAGGGASSVRDQPALFVGLVAFALVALLFMVVEELLLEAQEKASSQVWHISVWLYVGLLLSIVFDVVVAV